MSTVNIDSPITDEERRERLYGGDIFLYGPTESFAALCQHAWTMICEAFDARDPRQAQDELPVEEFVDIIAPLKTRFTHDDRCKDLIRDLLAELGADPSATYFDVPRLRVVTSGDYLTAGVGYAYKAHRDTWYACPPSQINWWGPIHEIDERCGLAFHPSYFSAPVQNSSGGFDAYQWNADARKNAAKFISSDSRPHPNAAPDVALDSMVLVGPPASVLLFSAQQLHATVPNTSGSTRFSVDFRTVHRDDVEHKRGARVIDSDATGTTLRDFINAVDHHRFPDEVVAGYETGSTEGVLIFEPEEAE